MKTKEAIALYNEAEIIVINSKVEFKGISGIIRKAVEIEKRLVSIHGLDKANEILELVYEAEIH